MVQIIADFRIAWKRQSTQPASTYCDDDTIKNESLIGEPDSSYGWDCISGCDTVQAQFDAVCTQYDEEDDWSLGTGVAVFNITGNGDFEIK